MSKYKNKDGIELSFTGNDSLCQLVREVVSEAIDILDEGRHYECKEFLKENFNLEDKYDG